MILKNGTIFTEDGFQEGSIGVVEGTFVNAGSAEGEVLDVTGKYVLPGLIDVHGHGNSGYDFSTCDENGLRTMATYLAENGITSFAPASMTVSYDSLKKAYGNALALHKNRKEKEAKVVGINMEGPFFSYGKRGAQNPEYLKLPDFEVFQDLYDSCEGLIKIADVAPELEGAMDFIKKASELCTVSVAHTEAGYDLALEAFAAGATHVTHLFNGMNGIHHRNPGVQLAALEKEQVFAELICDGIHIHPAVIRMVFQLFAGRVVMISDALSCCGMEDGEYDLGELRVTLRGLTATLDDGTLAGSVTNLFGMMKNVISYGIPAEEAIRSCTINPAKQLKMESEIGSIKEGKRADFIICDKDWNLEAVYIEGQKVR
ncbi:MAG: N-acetylglucosamine-6-phosphate deacetylase [Lachnospiraceae bacterium]|nr:N-acetylglucosamine-6-phosphate deacetylase [Lachnospiraceae bacterium]